MLRAVFIYFLTSLFILLLGVPLLIYSAISGNTDTLYRVGVYCAGLLVRMAGVRVEVSGRKNIPTGRAAVFMLNHQSTADPPAIAHCLPPVLFLAKKEVFRIPVLGRAMRLRGFIPVDRSDRSRAIEAVQQAARALRSGKSFLVFPEGTRSRDGRLQPFKKGTFIMAIEAGAPIVPISLSGASRVMRKGEWTMRRGVIRVTFHEPVETEVGDLERVMAKVREAIIQGLTDEERPLNEAASRDD